VCPVYKNQVYKTIRTEIVTGTMEAVFVLQKHVLPVQYRQIVEGKYDAITYFRLETDPWDYNPTSKILTFGTPNGQPKQHMSTRRVKKHKNPNWAQFLEAQTNPFFRLFLEDDELAVDAMTSILEKPKGKTWGRIQRWNRMIKREIFFKQLVSETRTNTRPNTFNAAALTYKDLFDRMDEEGVAHMLSDIRTFCWLYGAFYEWKLDTLLVLYSKHHPIYAFDQIESGLFPFVVYSDSLEGVSPKNKADKAELFKFEQRIKNGVPLRNNSFFPNSKDEQLAYKNLQERPAAVFKTDRVKFEWDGEEVMWTTAPLNVIAPDADASPCFLFVSKQKPYLKNVQTTMYYVDDFSQYLKNKIPKWNDVLLSKTSGPESEETLWSKEDWDKTVSEVQSSVKNNWVVVLEEKEQEPARAWDASTRFVSDKNNTILRGIRPGAFTEETYFGSLGFLRNERKEIEALMETTSSLVTSQFHDGILPHLTAYHLKKGTFHSKDTLPSISKFTLLLSVPFHVIQEQEAVYWYNAGRGKNNAGIREILREDDIVIATDTLLDTALVSGYLKDLYTEPVLRFANHTTLTMTKERHLQDIDGKRKSDVWLLRDTANKLSLNYQFPRDPTPESGPRILHSVDTWSRLTHLRDFISVHDTTDVNKGIVFDNSVYGILSVFAAHSDYKACLISKQPSGSVEMITSVAVWRAPQKYTSKDSAEKAAPPSVFTVACPINNTSYRITKEKKGWGMALTLSFFVLKALEQQFNVKYGGREYAASFYKKPSFHKKTSKDNTWSNSEITLLYTEVYEKARRDAERNARGPDRHTYGAKNWKNDFHMITCPNTWLSEEEYPKPLTNTDDETYNVSVAKSKTLLPADRRVLGLSDTPRKPRTPYTHCWYCGRLPEFQVRGRQSLLNLGILGYIRKVNI